jgi:ribosomal protein L21E
VAIARIVVGRCISLQINGLGHQVFQGATGKLSDDEERPFHVAYIATNRDGHFYGSVGARMSHEAVKIVR